MEATKPKLDVLIKKLDDPLKHATIAANIDSIVDSEDTTFLDDVIGNLLVHNDYNALLALWTKSTKKEPQKGQKIFDKYLNSALDRVAFAEHIMGIEHDEGILRYGMNALQLLDSVQDRHEDLLTKLLTNRSFYPYHPVTALTRSLEMENYSGSGQIAVHILLQKAALSSEYDVDRDDELQEIRESVIGDKEKLKSIISGRLSRIFNDDETKLYWQTRKALKAKLTEKVNELIKSSQDPNKAYESVGDAAMEYEWSNQGPQYRITVKGDYDLAVRYFILSGNVKKLLEASGLAHKPQEEQRGFVQDNIDRNAAFEGFKALYTQFKLPNKVRKEVENYLKIISSGRICYYSTEHQIEAAELLGDYTLLKKYMIDCLKTGFGPQEQIYNTLKTKGAVNESEVISEIETTLRTREAGFREDDLKILIKWADMTQHTIPRRAIVEAIDKTGLRNTEFAKTAFEYLKDTNQLTTQDRKVYNMIK